MLKTVKEIADIYGVTPTSVYNWLKGGLKFTIEKKVGIKKRKVIDPKDVDIFLGCDEGGDNESD